MCTCTTNAAQPSSGIFFYETNWDVNYNLFSPLEWWSKQNVELEFVKKMNCYKYHVSLWFCQII